MKEDLNQLELKLNDSAQRLQSRIDESVALHAQLQSKEEQLFNIEAQNNDLA